MPRSASHRFGSIALVVVAIAAGTIAACSKKEGLLPPPPPVVPGTPVVAGNRIEWTTDQPARASVRYGTQSPANLDHMAYPDAANRRDRVFAQSHSVALLDLAPGRKVYFQTVNEIVGLQPVYSSLDSFAATTGPVSRLLISTMIHIGFGDSHLITMPNTGKHFLIDSGEEAAETSVVTYLNNHAVTHVDALMATHTHLDHMGGVIGGPGDMNGVLWDFPPEVVFDSPTKSSSAGSNAYREFLRSIPPTTRRVILMRGQSTADVADLRLDPDVHIKVLNSGTPPGYVPSGYSGTDTNNESIVLRFSYGDVDFTIGGDAEDATEGSIVQAFPANELEVEFAKVHHHGLPDASSSSWVSTLKPRVAFIPNTQLVWDGNLAEAISESSGRMIGIGAHVYVVDDAPQLGKPRSSGRQFNVSFVTDGISYEVRLEVATQSVPPKPDATNECGQHAYVPLQLEQP